MTDYAIVVLGALARLLAVERLKAGDHRGRQRAGLRSWRGGYPYARALPISETRGHAGHFQSGMSGQEIYMAHAEPVCRQLLKASTRAQRNPVCLLGRIARIHMIQLYDPPKRAILGRRSPHPQTRCV